MPLLDRAATPEQKAEVLRRIGELWATAPDLRLLQMLVGSVGIDADRRMDPFYVEDFDLLRRLEAMLNQGDVTEQKSPHS